MGARDPEVMSMLMTWAGPHAGPWFLFFPLLWIALVLLLIVTFRGGWGRRRWQESSAESILGDRFAKGEIEVEEYRERLTELRRK
jgi:putative membrane protein